MLIERLTEQLISSRRINPNEAKRMAKGLLEKQVLLILTGVIPDRGWNVVE